MNRDQQVGRLDLSKIWLSISILLNLSLLIYFKYSNFFMPEIQQSMVALGLSSFQWVDVTLPIGISFFTFQKITYIVDIYRQKRGAFTNFIDFGLYVVFFPQLIAGPIIRFHEISKQILARKESLDQFYQGVLRFCWGLSKKVLFANPCGEISDWAFSLPYSSFDTQTAWLGVIAYTLQIYFDFSAYSDMAIGLGRMFGFQFPENFNRPYSAISITDFWRRWHMTLTRFFRDYLYIPLGGNRSGPIRTYFNLMVVFLLCGLWHGANWTFLIWGAYHGALLILERITGIRDASPVKLPVIRRLTTLFLVMIGWVLFRATGMDQASDFLTAMFFPYHTSDLSRQITDVLNYRNLFFLGVASTVIFLPPDFSGYKFFLSDNSMSWMVVRMAMMFLMIIYSVALLSSGSFNPFIYFQF